MKKDQIETGVDLGKDFIVFRGEVIDMTQDGVTNMRENPSAAGTKNFGSLDGNQKIRAAGYHDPKDLQDITALAQDVQGNPNLKGSYRHFLDNLPENKV